jgi:hypothetical protein
MRLDLHVHSRYSSDGRATPGELLRQAAKLGLGGIAITDHNTMKGSANARKVGGKVLLMRGMEISSAEGHILAYGIADPVPAGLSAAETVEAVRAQGGIAVVAHPYRPWSGLGEKATLILKPDAIEVQNSHSTRRENSSARKLCESMGLPMTGGSDAHALEYLGKSSTTVPDASTEDEVLEAVRKGLTKASGKDRSTGGAIKDRTDTVLQWVGRGFRKM